LRISDGKPPASNEVMGGGTLSPCNKAKQQGSWSGNILRARAASNILTGDVGSRNSYRDGDLVAAAVRLGGRIIGYGGGGRSGMNMRENRQARAAADVADCAGGASGGVWSGAT